MATLKEIKSRIQSIKSTQKITSAMKMVSSSKLRKAQIQIERFYPYEQKLIQILNNFLSAEEENSSIYAENREVKKVAIIALSSNSSLCGSFNSNVAKRLASTIEEYKYLGKENIIVYPLGKKIAQATKKLGFNSAVNYQNLIDKPSYKEMQVLADEIIGMYRNGEVDKVVLIFHRFKSKSSQVLINQTFLPISLHSPEIRTEQAKIHSNYLVEPNREVIMSELIPKVLRLTFFTALLDSAASEHAARTIAMQIATDNADDLRQELNLQYNKSRQQAITNELLDIIGGSFGRS